MRSYLDIMIDLKEGRKPEYEEIRLACLMASDLLFFTERDLKRVLNPEVSGLVRKLTEENVESRFYMKKRSPEDFLGNHHPDNPEQQTFMEMGNKILNKVINRAGINQVEALWDYQSKKWDMDISFSELLEINDTCKVDRNYKRHKLDNCYDGYCMYLKHPKSNEFSLMIGINHDGFMYLGDGENNELPFEETGSVLREMFFFGEYIKYKTENLSKIN